MLAAIKIRQGFVFQCGCVKERNIVTSFKGVILLADNIISGIYMVSDSPCIMFVPTLRRLVVLVTAWLRARKLPTR